MRVPYTGSFRMFDTGSDANPNRTSIRGSQKHNANDNVDGNTRFSHNIADAKVPLFDDRYAGNIESLSDISGSLQWRGYPVEISCYTCSFEEVGDPSMRTLILSASALEDGVFFNVRANGAASPINGGVTASVSSGGTVVVYPEYIGSDETFLGYSYSPDGSTGTFPSNPSTSTYNLTINDNVTIYALARLSTSIRVTFCYNSSGGKTSICEDCGTNKVVYFNRNDFETQPLEDLIWYENSTLTVLSDQGYYRRKNFVGSSYTIDDTIYYVTGSNGQSNIWDNCNGFISCT